MAPVKTRRRRCTGETKDGSPCKAAVLKDSDTCLAHADAITRESVGFIAANGKAGRKPNPKPSEIKQQLMERYKLVVQRPYWRTLGYDVKIDDDGEPYLEELEDGGAKLFGVSKDGEVCVSDAEDLGAQIAAAEKLEDRVYGKPKSSSEVTVITRDGIEQAIMDMEAELAGNDPTGPNNSARADRAVSRH